MAKLIVDRFHGGIELVRGKQYMVTFPYRRIVTYEFPLLGVSSLTNVAASGTQYPASFLQELPEQE